MLLSSEVHTEGLAALRANGGRAVLASDAHPPDVVVDGIVGIGGRPGLREEAVEALALFEGVPVVAVDVPSGVDVDTGRLDGPHVTADLTVTFGTHKIAHLVDPAARACGVVHLVDIGLDLPEAPVETVQPVDVAAMLPVPGPFDQKYTRGVVGVRAGSETYPGAAVLCTSGAVSGLTGMVRYLGSAGDAVRARHPEIVVSDGRVQAWVVGSGGDVDAEQALADALADGVPTVVDADALTHVARGPKGLVLTPHAGELARMLGVERDEVEAEQLSFARRAAEEYDAVVLLKGRRTLIARPDGRVRVTTSGVPWLAVAGAGDVLAGVVGFVARRRVGPVGRSVRRLVAARCGGRPGERRRTAHRDTRGRRHSGGGAGTARLNGTMLPMASPPASPHAEVVVDLGAVRHNVRRLRELVAEGGTTPRLMVVVKADGYGHGMLPVARAARSAGAEWLGVATGEEALALREAGDTGRLLCWLAAPGNDFAPLVSADVDVTASSLRQLEDIVRGAVEAGETARVQLKVDTGLSRNGAPRDEWLALVTAARSAQDEGALRVTGLWSHFACSDEPHHPANDAQQEAFEEALALATDAGLEPEVRHLANSAAALLRPSSRYDLVRVGIAAYGFSPAPDVTTTEELGLVPAMTVRGSVVLTKDLAVGAGVSYGHTFVAEEPMRVALVPMGYGDGIPRHASNAAEVLVHGVRGRVLGRICMDQFVVEAPGAHDGDEVVLFGPGSHGEPTATDWARWCGTIDYEIVTRMGGRQTRVWVGEEDETE